MKIHVVTTQLEKYHITNNTEVFPVHPSLIDPPQPQACLSAQGPLCGRLLRAAEFGAGG